MNLEFFEILRDIESRYTSSQNVCTISSICFVISFSFVLSEFAFNIEITV